MKNSILAVIVGALLVGCGGADTAETKSLANEQALKAAAPTGATGSTTCNTGDGWWNGPNPIPNNLVVPAGATCRLGWVEVIGNTTVNGSLYTIGSTFDGNVSVSGTGSALTTANWGNTFRRNLSITGSDGNGWINGFWSSYSDNVVDGNFSYIGNTAPFYVQNDWVVNEYNPDGYQCKSVVKGNLNVSASPCGAFGNLTVQGSTNISCY